MDPKTRNSSSQTQGDVLHVYDEPTGARIGEQPKLGPKKTTDTDYSTPNDPGTEQESRCHDPCPPSHVLPAKLSKEYVHAPLNVHLTMTTSRTVTETFEKQMIYRNPFMMPGPSTLKLSVRPTGSESFG